METNKLIADELKEGDVVLRGSAEGTVIKRTQRTITIKFPVSTCRITFTKGFIISELGITLKPTK